MSEEDLIANPEFEDAPYELGFIPHNPNWVDLGLRFKELPPDEAMKDYKTLLAWAYRNAIPRFIKKP